MDSHSSFIIWCCERHNEVNEKLGKPITPCNAKKLDERWKVGSEGCRKSRGWDDPDSRPSDSVIDSGEIIDTDSTDSTDSTDNTDSTDSEKRGV